MGQIVRRYPSHGAQLVSIGIRPIAASATDVGSPSTTTLHRQSSTLYNGSADNANALFGSAASARKPSLSQTGALSGSPRSADEDYDPLFDDDPDPDAGDQDPLGTGGRGASSTTAWRSGIPTLDPETYGRYSHNILMTAAIDGQITIWDRRVAGSAPGSGVGRLDIPEKTPPWCVSVRTDDIMGCVFMASWVRTLNCILGWGFGCRHAGQQTALNSMLADGMVRLKCGICAR